MVARHAAEARIKYNFVVDSMPTEDIPPVDKDRLQRMVTSALSTHALSQASIGDTVVAQLLHEVNTDYLRAQAKLVLDEAVASVQRAVAAGRELDETSLDALLASIDVPASEVQLG
jgi:hypothetical protein